jgi:hypothetical protein
MTLLYSSEHEESIFKGIYCNFEEAHPPSPVAYKGLQYLGYTERRKTKREAINVL